MLLIPVVISGGSGTRLWPLSRSLYPKQFLSLVDKQTMLQSTIQRLNGLNSEKPVTICNEEHRFVVAEQLRSIGKLGPIILEPEGRNTAPAVAVSAGIVSNLYDKDVLLLVLAADHVIQNESSFIETVNKAIPLAQNGALVTFGIVPDAPNTGYGYIKVGDSYDTGFKVDQFVEKPDLNTAQEYLDSGSYFWNSGMFLFKASAYLEELNKYRNDIAQSCSQAIANCIDDSLDDKVNFIRLNADAFLNCPSESIDYAVMEKTDKAVMVPLDAGWSDVGSWASLLDVSEKDSSGNAIKGDAVVKQSRDCLVYSEERLVTLLGMEDTIVVDTKDALLVANKDKIQDIKSIVEALKSAGRSEVDLHREVNRPWGKYDSIDNGKRYQVKRITVNPGAKLSVQMHHHRAEHWIVVSGTAKVTNGDNTFILSENESTYIPVGVVHALENPGKMSLELIEVQSGSYLGEDDIVRFEDKYGRVAKDV